MFIMNYKVKLQYEMNEEYIQSMDNAYIAVMKLTVVISDIHTQMLDCISKQIHFNVLKYIANEERVSIENYINNAFPMRCLM